MIMTLSSIVPQVWLVLVKNTGLSFTHIMSFWMCLSAASLFVGIWQLPWHNLPNGQVRMRHLATFAMLKRQQADILHIGPKVFGFLIVAFISSRLEWVIS